MTKEITPRPFHFDGKNDVVEIADVTLHQSIEADADGRILKLIWIEGRALPRLARETMKVELDFALFSDDEQLGACRAKPLEIDGDQETADFKAESDLRIPRNAEVSKIEMRMTATTINRFDPVDLNPQPLPPIAEG